MESRYAAVSSGGADCQCHLYQHLCRCVLLEVPLVFLSCKSFVSILKFLSTIHPHYCFYVLLVSVSSLSLLRIWAVARVDT
jgi:amino acid permease